MSRKIRVRRWGNVDCGVRCPAPRVRLSVCVCLSGHVSRASRTCRRTGSHRGSGSNWAQIAGAVWGWGGKLGKLLGTPSRPQFPPLSPLAGPAGRSRGKFSWSHFRDPGGSGWGLLSTPTGAVFVLPRLPGREVAARRRRRPKPPPPQVPHPGSPREGRTVGRRGAAWRKQVETRARPLQVTWLRLLARWNSGCLWLGRKLALRIMGRPLAPLWPEACPPANAAQLQSWDTSVVGRSRQTWGASPHPLLLPLLHLGLGNQAQNRLVPPSQEANG